MEIDCLRKLDSKNITLRERLSDSDSLVKNQSLSELNSRSERDASFTNYAEKQTHAFLTNSTETLGAFLLICGLPFLIPTIL